MARSEQTVNEIVNEIMRMHRSLPPRPSLEEVEAAIGLIKDVQRTELSRLEMVQRQPKPPGVPEELFSVLQEMQKNLIYFQGNEEKREALALLDLEQCHRLFDDLLQKASGALSQTDQGNSRPSAVPSFHTNGVRVLGNGEEVFLKQLEVKKNQEVGGIPEYSKDDSFIQNSKVSHSEMGILGSGKDKVSLPISFVKPSAGTGDDGQKLSAMKVASLIEAAAKKGAESLDLQGRLVEQLERFPDSIGKLSSLVQLNLSENHIVTLPISIGSLSRLTNLDLHSNHVYSLPDSIGQLSSLTDLDLHGNRLKTLPASIGDLSSLTNLNLSANQLSSLPESIGNLTNLKSLNIETNEIEELPYTIGKCTALIELRADFNHLKALPEAVGKLVSLEVLTLHYNRIKNLPTTMESLSSLKELDVSFNELESIPESLCFATSLVKLNVGRNFADFQSLPRSIGNLQMLEELDISSNQIKFLPDSFNMLNRLRVLAVEETPLEVPPRYIAEMGAQAVVQYMKEQIAKREEKSQVTKPKGRWSKFLSYLQSLTCKRRNKDYVKT